eukprot:CAMPEP_0174855794 /NCGR_PEP_ID=MMETSP1114-20130205/34222_1 /TAXON_ID=312471 /ORGANISM="Neobodo designis, Strain CCAP 1951/1" /LENGTH=1055 /DNA_ID=CAMNT_0016090561 /DNA_START=81 /DNA_END=3248 /DNA_ORIENTATION=+
MSKIKVYVRVRPALPGEFDAPGCYNCTELEDVSGNWIQIKKDGEPKRYFSRVWGPMSSQEEVFRTIGVSTVSDVMEGYYGCIFVYGQTGTGKTFSLGCTTPGLEGIQPRCIQFLFEKIAKESAKYEVVVKQQYVQLYRDSVQDLLEISKDNLVVRVDETGATIENVTTREVTSYKESIDLIAEGDGNRAVANTKMNSASSRSHACLITEVHRKNRETGESTMGRLYLIDLAGSERVSKSGVTGDAYKEAVAINKSLTTLGNCIAALVAGEKVVAFRDSKLTRVLQHSLSGNGRTSIIVTIRPDSPNMQETLCTLKFGERAQKVEAQMTPASYRDQCVELTEKVSEHERAASEAVVSVRVNKKWQAGLADALKDAQADLKAASAEVNRECDRVKEETKAQEKSLKDAAEADKRKVENATAGEVESLKAANASVLKEIEDRVQDSERTQKDKYAKELKSSNDKLAKLKAENEKLQSTVDASNVDESNDPHAIAAKRIAQLREAIAAAKRKIRGCRPSANEGVPLHELMDRADDKRLLRAKLREKRDRLLDRADGWDRDAMESAFEKPEDTVVDEFVLKTKEEESDDDAPPSSEPPPTDSDEDSSDDSDDSDSSDSSSDDSSDSDTSSSGDSSGSEVMERVDLDGLKGPGASMRRKPKVLREPPPRAHFDHALQRDAQLSELLEQIVEYLEYGCTCYILNSKAEPASLHKRHMFLGKTRKAICVAEYKDGAAQPDRTTGREIMQIGDITELMLGQFSRTFLKALEGAPMVPQGTTMPPTSAKITVNSLPVFFYRSLTMWNHDTPVIDVVYDTDTDFEAWMVTLHRFTGRDPLWQGPLDITSAKEVSRLSDDEKKMCSESHILPSCLLQTKSTVLHKEPRLFYTLFDMRSVSSLDLLHAQRLFEFFIKQGYFERVNVYQIRLLDILKAEKEAQERKEKQRDQRVRIVMMCMKYVPDQLKALPEFMKEVTKGGKEEETLNNLVANHGPEPDAAEVEEKDLRKKAEAELEKIEAEKKKKKAAKGEGAGGEGEGAGGEGEEDAPPPPPGDDDDAPPPPPATP